MFSTGPLFLSVIWKEYKNGGPKKAGRVRILMQDEYNRYAWSFFKHYEGSSWHGKDAKLIFWMGSHWFFLTVMGFLIAGVVGFCLWWLYGRMLTVASRKRQPSSPRLRFSLPTIPLRWRGGVNKQRYELVDRHEV